MHYQGLPLAVRAAAWMTVAIVSFLGMAVAIRDLADTMSTFEILFFRSLICVLIVTPLLLRRGGHGLHTARLRLHVARNLIHFGGQYGWALGVTLLPLAQVFALEFTTPIWALLLAVLVLGERLTVARLVAVVGGFIGVLIVLRPDAGMIQPAALIILAAALCFAASVIMVKALTRTDAALTIVFYMSLLQLPMGLLPALPIWAPPTWADIPALLVVGVGALAAHYALARALAIADASVIFPIDFLRLPAVAVMGYLWYGEALDAWIFVGAALIFGANYYGVRQEARTTSKPAPVRAA